MQIKARLAALVVAASVVASGPRALAQIGHIVVTNETPAVERVSELARGGISFAPGNAPTSTDHIHFLLDPGETTEEELPAQVQQLGRSHLNGAVRHALVQFPITLTETSPTRHVGFYIDASTPRPAPTHAVTLTSTVNPNNVITSVTVVTGALEVRLDAGCFHLPNRVKFNGQTILDNTASCSTSGTVVSSDDVSLHARIETATTGILAHTYGRATEPGVTSGVGALSPSATAAAQDFSAELRGPVELTVEESGPLRAVVLVQQPASARDASGRFGFQARLFFEAGRPAFRVAYTLAYQAEPDCTYDFVAPPVAHIEELTYRFGPSSVTSSAVATGAESMPLDPVNVHAMPTAGSGWSAVVLPGQAPSLDAGWAVVEGAAWRAALANRYFEGVGPKRIHVTSGRVENQLLLRPAEMSTAQQVRAEQQLALHGGHTRTWEFLVDFSETGGTVSAGQAGQRARALASRSLVATHEPWDAATRESRYRFAAEDAGASTRASLPSLATYHNNSRLYENGGAPRDGQVFGWFAGDRDFGANTAMADMLRSQGGQYGPAHSVLMRYRSSGNLNDLRKGEDMIRFALNTSLVSWATVGSDDCHGSYAPAGREPLSLATNMHSGEQVSGNNYLAYNDVANYYFLTGDRRVVDILRGLARWYGVQAGTEVPVSGLYGREFYAPFAAFLDAWEVLGDNREMCAVLNEDLEEEEEGCTATESSERPAGGELDGADARKLFASIRDMRDLASGISLVGSNRDEDDHAMLDASAIASIQPDRMAPDLENPVFDLNSADEESPLFCRSGLRSQTSTTSEQCIPFYTPGLVGSNMSSAQPDVTPFYVSFGTTALAGYYALTGDSVTREAINASTRIQHLFINPFGLFQAKALGPSDLRFSTQEDFVASSAAVQALADQATSSEAWTRLVEAAPSVDYRLNFRRRYNNTQRFGTDADLYPFLAAWVDFGLSESSLHSLSQYAIWQSVTRYDLEHPQYRTPSGSLASVFVDDPLAETFSEEQPPNPLSVYWDVYFRLSSTERTSGGRLGTMSDLFGAAMYARARLAVTSQQAAVCNTNYLLDNCRPTVPPLRHSPGSRDTLNSWTVYDTQGPSAGGNVRNAMMAYSQCCVASNLYCGTLSDRCIPY